MSTDQRMIRPEGASRLSVVLFGLSKTAGLWKAQGRLRFIRYGGFGFFCPLAYAAGCRHSNLAITLNGSILGLNARESFRIARAADNWDAPLRRTLVRVLGLA